MHSTEVVIQGEKRKRLQFGDSASHRLLDSVHDVEKGPSIKLQLPAAEFPVRSQKEMKSEDLILEFIEHALPDQGEIGDVFFPLAGVGAAGFPSVAQFQLDRSRVRSGCHAFTKTVEAGSKGGPKYAIARYFPIVADKADPVAVTIRARHSGDTNCAGSIPLHVQKCPPGGAFSAAAACLNLYSI
jgi:hypothetical protein